MKNKLRELLAGVYEAGEYHARAKSNADYKQKDIDQAVTEIFSLARECAPGEIKDTSCNLIESCKMFGFNDCRQRFLANIEEVR